MPLWLSCKWDNVFTSLYSLSETREMQILEVQYLNDLFMRVLESVRVIYNQISWKASPVCLSQWKSTHRETTTWDILEVYVTLLIFLFLKSVYIGLHVSYDNHYCRWIEINNCYLDSFASSLETVSLVFLSFHILGVSSRSSNLSRSVSVNDWTIMMLIVDQCGFWHLTSGITSFNEGHISAVLVCCFKEMQNHDFILFLHLCMSSMQWIMLSQSF